MRSSYGEKQRRIRAGQIGSPSKRHLSTVEAGDLHRVDYSCRSNVPLLPPVFLRKRISETTIS
ncbi:MAG: hypothetical protein OXI86_09745, partial [Candidatus Poribacteria bacterium]|nr:hypothetical protein [Candidatus Poribacteria bacterium]